MTTNEFLSRTALNPNGRLGLFSDLRLDQLTEETMTTSLPRKTDRPRRQIQCSIENCDDERISNLLKLIRINDELRLSIASQLVPADGVAKLINATGSTNRFSRIFSYKFIDRIESFSNETLHGLVTNENENDDEEENDEHFSITGTHFIVSIQFGLEIHILFQLPTNENDVNRIDALLGRASMSLQNSQPIFLVGNDENLLRKITQTQIFSNVSSLSNLTNIVEFFQQINRIKSEKRHFQPVQYEFCPLTRLYSIENTFDFQYQPIDSSSTEKIENYILDLIVEVKKLRKQIDENVDELNNLYENELKRIRTWILNARRSISVQTTVDEMLKDNESIAFRRKMMKITVDAKQMKDFKEYFRNTAIPKQFQYRHADDYVINLTDDENALKTKIIGNEENLRVFLGNYRLYNENLSNWNQFCDQLLDEQRQNSRLKVIFVDFTEHPYRLDQLKILSSISTEIPVTPSTPTKIKLNDEVNVLFFGESGVGKSTLINSMINYLKFQSFADAENGDPLVLLPVSFNMTSGENFEDHQVEYEGLDHSQNEVHNQRGESVTQRCRSYLFTVKDDEQIERRIRFIDTPGMNDARGLGQDDANIKEILTYISSLTHLHAVCIVLRPNVTRLGITFRTALLNVFDLLGDKIRDNILFCFTNTRATFYSPGNTGPVLKKFLEILPIERIPFGPANTFCFDSESIRYLLAKRRGVPFGPDEAADCKETWQRSAPEATRLFKCITTKMNSFSLHQNSRTNKKAKFEINLLVRPMIEVMKNLLDQQSTKNFEEILQKSIHFGQFLLSDDYSLEKDFFIGEINRMISENSSSSNKEILQRLNDQYTEQMAKFISETKTGDLPLINRFIDELYECSSIRSQMREIKERERSTFRDREFQVPISGLQFNVDF